MKDFEKLGVFYLGRPYDLKSKKGTDTPLLYDSKDLVTHAVCVGMTGSGKTGLCISLLEEAAIDGIPAIAIDPKGDLSNLLLTFPKLAADDFKPWVNEEDARKQGVSTDEFAAQQAEMWKKGLAEWGEDGARIQRLRDAADMAIYTPGSNAGLPVSILKSFAAPDKALRDDPELLRERVATTATSLLGLLGMNVDPMQSREHILLSTILSTAWQAGRDLDLGALIQQIQSPPVTKVGVVDLESFYPAKERHQLAMQLNNLLAAPGFEAWLQGEALDIDRLLHTPQGKPRICIFSIAHLPDAQRMFFVSLLLNQVLAWMRTQAGTTSLRAVLYMDEIFGYFPPVQNPPSKAPLLTLLKQARAFGLGVVLATQNPVDLDYKGLANAGTWFIGRLQTERDKSRLIEGLEGAAATAGGKFDRQKMEQTLAGLGNRIFLLNNVHEDAPEVFQVRWSLSYLRGPLTRNQIKALMDPVRKSAGADETPKLSPVAEESPALTPAAAARSSTAADKPAASVTASLNTGRPLLPPDVPCYFGPVRRKASGTLLYRPRVIGVAEVEYQDSKRGVDSNDRVSCYTVISSGVVPVDWSQRETCSLGEDDLESDPKDSASFDELPTDATKAKNYASWKKAFVDELVRSQAVDLMYCEILDATSQPNESDRDFRVRLQQKAREVRDARTEELRKKYAAKLTSIEERVRKAQQAVDRESQQASAQKMQTIISFGATILGALMGRKKMSVGNIGRATTAARSASRTMKESGDVARANETVESLNQQHQELEGQLQKEIDDLTAKTDVANEKFETIAVKPKKTGVSVRLVGLVWLPYWDEGGKAMEAW